MYKEDVIYKKWEDMCNKQRDIKFKPSKRHKHYIDKPYIAPNTIDDCIVSYDEMKKIIQEKLCGLIFKGATNILFVPSPDAGDIVTVLDFEPLFNPVINGHDESVYNIRNISKIYDLHFTSISGTYMPKKIQEKIPDEYMFTFPTKQNMLSAKHLLSTNAYQDCRKLMMNSYYGIQSILNTSPRISISVIINGSWKVHAAVNINREVFFSYLQNLYEEGIVKFETYANIDLEYMTIASLVKDSLIYSNCKSNILTDALEYNKPCKFRKILFDYLENKDIIGYFEWLCNKMRPRQKYVPVVNFLFPPQNESVPDMRTNINEFIQQYRVLLLSAMNKYGDIVDNTEDISL